MDKTMSLNNCEIFLEKGIDVFIGAIPTPETGKVNGISNMRLSNRR